MANQHLRPVIFLGFANDKVGSGYLRGLTEERNGIRSALSSLNELCEVIVEPDLSIEGLFQTFTNQKYKDRIVLFHYAGHADTHYLLLESSTGQNSEANSEGWVSFLGRQRSLKLVFLNGCSSSSQSKALIEAGVPAVIGTDTKIDDTIATQLAITFYQGLTNGSELESAWLDAINQVQTRQPNGHTRTVDWAYAEDDEASASRSEFPWRMEISSTWEDIKAWSIPKAANHVLLGLEIDRDYRGIITRPEHPYPGLRAFLAKEADIFFGRGQDIRDLYQLCQEDYPIILLTGVAGVGKSSLLEAGLLPRTIGLMLVVRAEVGSQTASIGLTGILEEALSKAGKSVGLKPLNKQKTPKVANHRRLELETAIARCEGFAREVLEAELAKLAPENQFLGDLGKYWKEIEKKGDQALVIALDHLENLDAWNNLVIDEADWLLFIQAILSIFQGDGEAPKGKLLLCYRGPFHPRVMRNLRKGGLLFRHMELQPLSYAGMIEAVKGVAQGRLKEHFQLQIDLDQDKDLPKIIADDLREDAKSPIAPVFQAIMEGLWRKASKELGETTHISVRMYQELKQSGELMKEFLYRQLNAIAVINSDMRAAYQSGLLINLLYLHTDIMGRSQTLPWSKVKEAYHDRLTLIEELWEHCQDTYLISVNQENESRLYHDLLAPVVIREYAQSYRSGQKASRILESKVEEAQAIQGSKAPQLLLGDAELEIVEGGLAGMRCMREKEIELLDASKKAKLIRDTQKKRNQHIRIGFGTIVLLFAIFAFFQWRIAVKNLNRSLSSELAYQALELAPKDLTQALKLADSAFSILGEDSGPITTHALTALFHAQDSIPLYKHLYPHVSTVNTVVLSPDEKRVLTAAENGEVRLWKLNGNSILQLDLKFDVKAADFSPSANQILTLAGDSVQLWDLKGNKLDSRRVGAEISTPEKLASFSTDGRRIIASPIMPRDTAYHRWLKGIKLPNHRYFSAPNRQEVLVLDPYKHLNLLRAHKADSSVLVLDSTVRTVVHSRNGQYFVTITKQDNASWSQVKIWSSDRLGQPQVSFRYPAEVKGAWIADDAQQLLLAGDDKNARHYDFSIPLLRKIKAKDRLVSAHFSHNGQKLITAEGLEGLKVWDAQGRALDSMDHGGQTVKVAAAAPGDASLVASGDKSGKIRIWDHRLDSLVELTGRSDLSKLGFSPDGTKLYAAFYDSVKVWEVGGQFLGSYSPGYGVSKATFSPDGKRLAIASEVDSFVVIVSLPPGQDSLVRLPIEQGARSVAFSPDGAFLLVSGEDNKTVGLWKEGQKQGEVNHSPGESEETSLLNLLEVSPDGKHFVTGARDALIWEMNTQNSVRLPHSKKISTVRFSASGKLILTACADKKVRLWRLDGTLVSEFTHPANITSADFSPDGQQIITSAEDGYARIWWTASHIHRWLDIGPIYKKPG